MIKRKEKNILFGRWVSLSLTGLWLIGIISGFCSFGWIGKMPDLSPAEFVVQLSALLFPIGIFFMVGNYIDRAEIMEKERKGVQKYLEELIYPSEFGAKHVQTLNDELKQQIQLFRSSFSHVTEQTNTVREDLTKWIESLNQIITHMDKQSQNMAEYVLQLTQITEKAQEESAVAGRNLAAQADILAEVTHATNHEITQTTKQLLGQTEEIKQNTHAITQSQKTMAETLDKSGQVVTALAENAFRIEKAMKTTETMADYLTNTEKVLMRFKEIGTTIDMRLKTMKNLPPEKEKQLIENNSINAKKFTEQMQQILEKLQGLSVEMVPLFQMKNEESLWEQYYAGDKAIFMRHIKNILTNSKTQKIIETARKNPTFLSNVQTYMETFESLTHGLENSPWLGVLVGSDPGRLYMTLATVFKGEKNASKISENR